MPYQDDLPGYDNYKRDWVSNTTQRQDEKGNDMWEKQLVRDKKKGIPAVPILNFPAGGYWKYSAINTTKDDEPIVKHEVPEHFTDYMTKKDYSGNRKEKTHIPAVEKRVKHAREHLEHLVKEDIQKKFAEYMEEFSDDEDPMNDWNRESKFAGDAGWVQARTAEGGALPGSMAEVQPQGYYWKRDENGNDIWKDRRRVPAPLSEGKGLTRPGKVATHLAPYGRSGMYGGEEKIAEQLENANVRNTDYLTQIADKYAPFKEDWVVPKQTPEGEEDLMRSDKTKLTRDWTKQNLESIDPHDYTMGDWTKYWWKSSEGRLINKERKEEFDRWADAEYARDVDKLKTTPFPDKALHWQKHLGIKYGATGQDWDNAKQAKEELWKLWSAEHKAKTHQGLSVPGAKQMGELVVQMNGVVLDEHARPTGQVIEMPDDDPIPEEKTIEELEEMDSDDFEFGSDTDDDDVPVVRVMRMSLRMMLILMAEELPQELEKL